MISAQALSDLMALGLEGEKLLAVVTIFERDAVSRPSSDRRSKEALRAHKYRERQKTAVVTGVTDGERDSPPSSSPSSSFPLTLPLLTTPSSPTSSEKSPPSSDWPNDFREQFWAKYPRKTGKAGALRKLETVRRSGGVTFAAVIRAVDRYAAENPDLKFVKHPETWLSKGCWDDEPSNSNAPRAPPDAKPAYLTPPPGCEDLEAFRARFTAARKIADGQAAATQIRDDTGGRKNGPDKPGELPLSG